MKNIIEVISPPPPVRKSKILFPHNLTDNYPPYVGFMIPNQGNKKGFLMRASHLEGPYRMVSSSNTTQNNSWRADVFGIADKTCIRSVAETLIEQGVRVFIFDDQKDFFSWLAQ